MKIVDIYEKDNGIIIIENSSKLNGIEVETVQKKYTKDRAQRYLENLIRYELKKVKDDGIDIKLNYENIYVVTLYDYKKMNLKDIKPIVTSLEKREISLKNRKIKLQKNNKYAGGVIVALVLATSVALTTPFIVDHVIKKKEQTGDTNEIIEIVDSSTLYSKDEIEPTSLFLSNTKNISSSDEKEKGTIPNENVEEKNQSKDSFIPLNSGNNTKDEVYEYLKTKTDFNDAAIAGIMGNIQEECDYDINATYLETNGYTSHGLCQWNGERYVNLTNYCGNYDNSVNAQLDFMMKELKSLYGTAYNALINAENTLDGARQVALNFAMYYEGCSSSTYEIRQSYAENYFNIIHSLQDTSSSSLSR